jgi:hypothetical protein
MTVKQLQKVEEIQNKYTAIVPYLTERTKRLWAATEANACGWGGATIVNAATGISHPTIRRGRHELQTPPPIDPFTIRRPGGGRKKLEEKQPEILELIHNLVDPVIRGDPESPLLWIAKSTYKITDELKKHYAISQWSVCRILKTLGYSLQANRKTREGSNHPDRNRQFRYIASMVKRFIKRNNPAISVDTKKKENVGNYKNKGKEYQPKGKPCEVNTHDFIDKTLGKVAPYGIYEIGKNKGWMSIGISSDTAQFAVNAIRAWWKSMGKKRYPQATKLFITADCGGSNGNRVRLWKRELQLLANEIMMTIIVCHFPPGTSKWNKIEHRMFSYISQNWRGKPLITRETVVNLISNTTTKTGLVIKAMLDKNQYEKGIKISDEEFKTLRIEKHAFHGEWNYTIRPQHT